MGRGLKAYSPKWRFCHWLSLMSRMTDGLLWNTKGEICPKAKALMWFEQKGDGFLWITSWISIWASLFWGGGDSLCAALYGKCTMKCISRPFVLYWRNKSYRFGLSKWWQNIHFWMNYPFINCHVSCRFYKSTLCYSFIYYLYYYTNDLWGCDLYNPVFEKWQSSLFWQLSRSPGIAGSPT